MNTQPNNSRNDQGNNQDDNNTKQRNGNYSATPEKKNTDIPSRPHVPETKVEDSNRDNSNNNDERQDRKNQ